MVFGDDKLWAGFQEITRKLAKKGWLALGWPEEYGGQSGSYLKKVILIEEMTYFGVAGIDPFGVKMLAPILLAHGNKEQKAKHLPPIARGETQWCQCFSEPDAGSDLASLKTRAKDEGDHFVVNGQKVWTSGAHRSTWGFLLARTDTQESRHRGLTFLLVDLKTPGITVRPLTNILGESCFNEVYFDNVRVPKENMVGEKNKGWYVAMSLESFERSGIEHYAECRRYLDKLITAVKDDLIPISIPLSDARQRLTQLAVETEINRWIAYRVAWMQSQRHEVACEAAMSKLYGSELMQRIGRLGMQILGPYGQLLEGTKWAPLKGDLEKWYIGNLGRTIGGGTSEIQRTIIAMRGLDLPR
jgi:alkylation response protein AidB-like acyl-CoA dehydrogenase